MKIGGKYLRFRPGSWILFIVAAVGFIYAGNPASAETYSTNGPNDFYFTLEESNLFSARAYASQYGVDSMLWLYDSSNKIISANDDYFGLDSYISIVLEPGEYRLRTGVCCGDPNAWYGSYYEIETNISVIGLEPITTTTSTTIVIPVVENSEWGIVDEGWTLTLTAPNGGVFSDVLFASYGTPNMNNNQFSLGECHAQNSQQIVESIAIGQSSFSVDANNSVFGDPCGGTPKRLAVVAAYTVVEETTTTSTTSTTTTSTTTTSTIPTVETIEETTTTIELPTTTALIPAATTTTNTIQEIVTTETVPTVTSSSIPESTTTTLLIPQTTTSTVVTTTTVPQTTTVAKETNGGEASQTTLPKPAPDKENEAPQTDGKEVTPQSLLNLTEEKITPSVANQVVNVITSGEASKEQIIAAVSVLIQSGSIDASIAGELATSPVVLQSISGDVASEIFNSVDISSLNSETAELLVIAVQSAPEEVKESFEEEINVFGGKFDEYVPLDSNISVGERRTVVAVTVVSSVIAVSAASVPPSSGGGSSGGGGGSPSGGNGDSSKPRRRRGG